ncbi:hypothetical protein NMY22_g3476 [Coprinellus aureogranulatus]|nr:hypothetical protein NMY22_g3476 [Coprinellus aureogranulatus]
MEDFVTISSSTSFTFTCSHSPPDTLLLFSPDKHAALSPPLPSLPFTGGAEFESEVGVKGRQPREGREGSD